MKTNYPLRRLHSAVNSSHFLHLLLLLPLSAADWQLVPERMLTPWATEVKVDNVWQEYPRPQFERASWQNLNGLWDYAVTPKENKRVETWAGKILVPFCPESALSGVGRLIEPTEALWYKRSIPAAKKGKRILLHFEAVDYESNVWINGTEIGKHTGGHTPFSYDITDKLKETDNELMLRVDDATEGYQLHGKQKLTGGKIWYTRVTGIWQTVWLEEVNPSHFSDVDYSCDLSKSTLTVSPKIEGPIPTGGKVRLTVSSKGQKIAESSTTDAAMKTLEIRNVQTWSPESPHLYDVLIELLDKDGAVLDSVKSYTAMRSFGKTKDAQGHWRFTLNNKEIFHWGPLDQGWWPDGLLTPPSDAAMLSDIEFLKSAGFNMIRKHIKVEPRRYYYHCDRLGMLMWQDQVSTGFGGHRSANCPKWTTLEPNPQDAKWPQAAHDQYVVEYKRMIDHLRDSPCIAAWVPFNEAWGQHNSMEIGKMAVDYDKTRAINIASGGNFWPVGDIADRHNYPNPAFPLEDKRFDEYIKVVGEFGGHGWPVKDHLWKKNNDNWGYGGLPKSIEEWKQRYSESINILRDLRGKGLAAGVYTQTTDVEMEVNGLLTYDRVNKIDPSWLKGLADKLLAPP